MSFDRVSDEYAEKSLIQKSAARKLMGLLDLRGNESVLDVGCGPGHITALLAGTTTGKVLGTDVSEAMIEEARSSHSGIDAYREMFERHGFVTVHLSIDHEVDEQTVEEAYGVYAIGAAVGYANSAYYECDITDEYVEGFNRAVREEMERISDGGRVLMDFNRLYYVGEKD